MSAIAKEIEAMVVEWLMTGGPDGEVRRWFELDDGATAAPPTATPTAGEAGEAADLVLTSDHATTEAIASGEVRPSVAYMRGDLKAAGSTGLLLDLLARFDELHETAALGALLQK